MSTSENTRLLVSLLSEDNLTLSASKNERIELVQDECARCIIIHKGTFAIYRRKRGLLLDFLEGPEIIGITSLISDGNMSQLGALYIHAYTPLTYEVVSKTVLEQKIRVHNLWQPVTINLCERLLGSICAHTSIAGRDIEHIVIQSLHSLFRHSEDFRSSILAAEYIRQKTQLSRSAIMKVLKDLKARGDININRGILVGIVDEIG